MEDWVQQFLTTIVAILFVAALLGLVGLLLLHRRLRRIRIPPNADFATTLRAVPVSLVVVLDLLDFGLDIFATPIVWLVLSRYKLQALRNVAAVEALVPFTQPIPTLTLSWIAVRALGMGQAPPPEGVIDVEEETPGYYVPRTGRR